MSGRTVGMQMDRLNALTYYYSFSCPLQLLDDAVDIVDTLRKIRIPPQLRELYL